MRYTAAASSLFWLAALVSLLCTSLVAAQSTVTTTVTNADGSQTVELVFEDVNGDPTLTSTLSTIPAATATTTAANQQGNQGQVGAPVAICTTAGCTPLPTTYTVATTIGGAATQVILTWFATTPLIPTPTWASSGTIEPLASYITTTITVKGQSSSSSPSSSPWFCGDHAVLVLGAVFAGFLGAAIVL